ncbi:MAG TPA: FAD:protein FMN transferase [Acidimicrobiia bacterium]|nr:FAD:protein FMN transferase [Acidimicrobiia bacterium]
MQWVEVLSAATPVPAPAVRARGAERWHERRFRAMGSTAHLVVRGGPESAVDWAVAEVARLESLWSRFRPTSDVARCNAPAAAGRPVPIARETVDLLERAIAMWRLTGGRFDPTVLHALEANGYDETFERVRARAADRVIVSAPAGRPPLRLTISRRAPGPVDEPGHAPGCAGIVLDRADRTVRLPAGVGIDLGGIGKGFAADLVARGLVERGAAGACVALGGDVRTGGRGPGDGPWLVPVEDPFDEQSVLFTHALDDGAIVTSTRLFRRWVHDGRLRHHIIDPATGAPADTGVAAVVVADRVAWRAEALAKAALIAGLHDGRALLEGHGVEAWIVEGRP